MGKNSLEKEFLDLINTMLGRKNKIKEYEDTYSTNNKYHYNRRPLFNRLRGVSNSERNYNNYLYGYNRNSHWDNTYNGYNRKNKLIDVTNNRRLHKDSYKWIMKKDKTTIGNIVRRVEYLKGNNVYLGILDSNFEKFVEHRAHSHIKEKFIGRGAAPYRNNSPHGTNVLEFMTEGTNFNVIAGSFGTERNGISYQSEDYRKLFNLFINKGQKVKIVNQSFGSTSKDYYGNEGVILENYQLEIHRPWIEIYKNYINNHGALFIISNGNTAERTRNILNNGGVHTQYPRVDRELLKGWISVVGIDGNTNQHFRNFSRLAYAGVAKDWAISADGFRKKNLNRAGTYWHIDYGSSYAAPRVSRTAGLILSKYPWMKNSQIRETLFTTTNKSAHVGNQETDRQITDETTNEYGWGIMNTVRTLKGPGAFWKKLLKEDRRNYEKNGEYYFTADIPYGEFYFENNIVGDSGLVKDGILEIYGSQNSDIDIEKTTNKEGIVVLGDGADTRSIYNSGALVVQEKAKINGYYNAKNYSDTIINIDKETLLTVTGKADFEDKSMLTLETWNYPLGNSTYKIIESNVGISGIKNVTITGMRKAIFNLKDKEASVNIERKNAVEHTFSTEDSILYAARNLEEVLTEIDDKIANNRVTSYDLAMGRSIVNKTSEQLAVAESKMTGEIYASAQNMSFIQAQNVNRTLADHLFSLNNFKNMQAWFLAFGSNGKLKQDGFATANTKVVGGQLGIDKKITANIVVGGAINYSYGKLNFNRNAGRTKSDSVGLSIYTKHNVKNNAYILARLGLNRFSNRTERELIDIDGKSVLGNIKHHDEMLSTYFEFGKKFREFTPYIAYSKDYLKRGNFKESNAAWGLSAHKKIYQRDNLYLGLRTEKKLDKLKIDTYVEHIINVGNRELDFKAKFIGANGNKNFKGIKQDKYMTYVGLGATYEMTENIDIKVNLDEGFKEKKHSENIASFGFNYKF